MEFWIKDKRILVDEEDYDRVKVWSWYVDPKNYVRHKDRHWSGILSRFVLNYTGPLVVDHINHDPCDNHKANLRIVTQSENMNNRSGPQVNNTTGFLGVCKTKQGYQAYVTENGKRKHLGYAPTAESAFQLKISYLDSKSS